MRQLRRPRLRSVSLLAVAVVLLMSPDRARAAGEVDDVGFIQAVVLARKNARENYERADQIDRVNAVEASRQREREALARRDGADGSPSGPDARSVSDPEEGSGGFPWGYALLMGASLAAFMFVRRQSRR